MIAARGRFIVVYAANNLGKSTQLDLLEKTWQGLARAYVRIKYPRYETETGKIINRELRGRLEERVLSEAELQAVYAQDRREYEPCLLEMLKDGDVFAEDYLGTGLAWGLTKGVSRSYLYEINSDLLAPDISVLLDGERFSTGIEKGHRFEAGKEGEWERNREIHLELAREFGWEVVEAGGTPEQVHERILRVIGEKW
jgi:thymidylate kinase